MTGKANDLKERAKKTERVRVAIEASPKSRTQIVRQARTMYDVLHRGRILVRATIRAIEKGLNK